MPALPLSQSGKPPLESSFSGSANTFEKSALGFPKPHYGSPQCSEVRNHRLAPICWVEMLHLSSVLGDGGWGC